MSVEEWNDDSTAEWKFYRKVTTEVSDDGWCYYFEVEDSKDPDKSPDRIVYSFGTVNLRNNMTRIVERVIT